MKRFLVTQRLTIHLHKVVDHDHVDGRDPRRSIDILHQEDPAIDPGEWTIESLGDKDVKATDRNLRMVVQSVSFLRTTTMRMADEKTVLAALAQTDIHQRNGLEPQPTAKGWWRSHSKGETLETLRVVADASQAKPKPSFVADIAALAAPDATQSYIVMDQAFETVRWMLATMTNYVEHHQRADHALSFGERGCDGDVKAVTSMRDLTDRIRFVLLARSNESLAQWREDLGITPTSKITIPLPTFGKDASKATGLWTGHSTSDSASGALSLVAEQCVGCDLSVVLNNVHPGAGRIAKAGVHIGRNGFSFDIYHGYPDEKHGSGWWRSLASTREGETFCETLERALARLRAIVPDLDAQLGERRVQAAKDRGILAA